MRSLAWPAVIVAAAGVGLVPGCGGPAKELPKVVPVAPDDPPDARPEPVPEKSEPAAAEVVAKAVRAATEGHPDRLAKVRVNRATMKGTVDRPGRHVATVRTLAAVWPDRWALADDSNDGNGPLKVLIRLRRPVLWSGTTREGQTESVRFPDPKAQEITVADELIGRHWLPLLLPLTDPKTVVFGHRKDATGPRAADVVKAAVPGCGPVFTLWFDAASGLLGRIDFDQREPGNPTPTRKQFVLFNHRLFGGVMAPGRVEYWHNGGKVEDWNVDAWEFPDRLDDATFDPPK